MRLPYALAIAFSALPVIAQAETSAVDLSIEDLLQTEISSVSRRAERLSTTAAAVFVISGEDIQRAGASSIPEALRLVPGVQVARMGNARWAVSARGFNARFSNKLLVLMDGRSIYSPLFSGVYWEQEDTLLEDVERIEVIRGPGAAMWGANAVNGVINIITRKARATRGGLATVSANTEAGGGGGARWGGVFGDTGNYRVWAKGSRLGAADHTEKVDPSRSVRAGFRLDDATGDASRLSVVGETYRVRAGDMWERPDISVATLGSGFVSPTFVTAEHSGANLTTRYDTVLGDGSELGIQGYVDHSDVDMPWALKQRRDTADLDLQHRLTGEANDFMWGFGYRFSRDHIQSRTPNFRLSNEGRTTRLFSAFVHDEWTVIPERLRLMAGTKVERDDSTGWQWQPNVRFAWTPSETQTLWGAISRAVRTPSQAEEDASIDLRVMPPSAAVPVYILNKAGAPGRLDRPEKVSSFELGYRQQVSNTLWFDVAAFVARYTDLRTYANPVMVMNYLVTPFGVVPYLETTANTAMGLKARTHGLELAADWHPVPTWRLQLAYAYLRDNFTDPQSDGRELSHLGKTPRHTASLRSSLNLARDLQFDAWLRHTSRLSGLGVPDYTELDLRLAWRPTRSLELSLVGQNLLHRSHLEWVGDLVPTRSLEVPRAWYVKAQVNF